MPVAAVVVVVVVAVFMLPYFCGTHTSRLALGIFQYRQDTPPPPRPNAACWGTLCTPLPLLFVSRGTFLYVWEGGPAARL